MKMTDLFAEELEKEAVITRRLLEKVPEGRNDWKPHEKSMPLGNLALLVGTILSWVDMTINLDELDVAPKDRKPTPLPATNKELLAAFDDAADKARKALAGTSDAHLMTKWRMLAAGQVVAEDLRYQVLRSGVFNHLAHHRGQLTVYLRLNDAFVPSVYGPTADDKHFG